MKTKDTDSAFAGRTILAAASPLVICVTICGAFLSWFSISTARMMEDTELRSQSENVTLLANYYQHLIDDLHFDARLAAERLSGRTAPSPAELSGVRADFRSLAHIRAFALFDRDGRVLASNDPLPPLLALQLPDLAHRLAQGPNNVRDAVFLPIATDVKDAGDIPDLLFASPTESPSVNLVFSISATLLGRTENVRATNVDAAFAMVDIETMTTVAFGRRSGDPPWSEPAVAGLMRSVTAGDGIDQAQCSGSILFHRQCITYHRLNGSSVALVGLTDADRLRRAWIDQSRPVWLFAACVAAGGLLSSILIGLWAHQRRADRRRLARALEETRAAYAAKSNFMAHLSHEFFTPLNSIIGFSELMRKALFGPLGEPYAGYVNDIHTSAIHLQDIAADIMDAELIERGKLMVDEGTADLNVAAIDAKRILAVSASKRGVAIDVVAWLRPAVVAMDPHRVMQIAVNLLSNAVKYSEHGDRVAVSVEKSEDGRFALTVTDHGIGMSREEIAHTEQPFGHPADRRKGRHDSIGLGLPIVRGLLAAVGGKLLISSEKNQGTTVSAVFGGGPTRA